MDKELLYSIISENNNGNTEEISNDIKMLKKAIKQAQKEENETALAFYGVRKTTCCLQYTPRQLGGGAGSVTTSR